MRLNNTYLSPSGVFGDVLSILSSQLNFTYSVHPAGAYGALQPDGATFNGMVGMIQAGEVDLAMELVASKARLQAVEFSVPVSSEIF